MLKTASATEPIEISRHVTVEKTTVDGETKFNIVGVSHVIPPGSENYVTTSLSEEETVGLLAEFGASLMINGVAAIKHLQAIKERHERDQAKVNILKP
jgi:hypothetical protein